MNAILLALALSAAPRTTGTYAFVDTAEAVAAGRFDPHWPARPGNRPENITFRSNGTVDIQCFMDREHLEYRWVERQPAVVLAELARNPRDPKTIRWAKSQPLGALEIRRGKEAWRERQWWMDLEDGWLETDLFQECGDEIPEAVMWMPSPMDAVIAATEDRMTRAALASVPSELRAGPTRVSISGVDATIDGKKLHGRSFPCAASCEDGAREEVCVEFRPEPGTSGPLFLIDGKGLIELVDATHCDFVHPSVYELEKGGRRFTGTPAPTKGPR